MATRKASKRVTKKSPSSIVDKITPVHETENNLVMLVYGRSGTGKTEFGSTFPTPILFIDVNERGTETIAHKSDIDLVRVTDWNELVDLYWYLKDGTDYSSVVIDQITNLQDLGMKNVMSQMHKKEGELFSKRNWGQLSGQLKNIISDYRELSDKYHVCLIAHERTFDAGDEEEDALEPSVGARVMPSVGSFLDGAVDAIGSTFIRESHTKEENKRKRQVDYCMRIGPHAFYSTKVRRPVESGPLPELIVNPSYQQIVDLTVGKGTTTVKKRKAKRRS